MSKIDNMLLAENERLNYSNYEPTEVIEIDKYIGEKLRAIINAVLNASTGSKELLLAYTGSGKTTAIIKTLKKLDKKLFRKNKIKVLLILPNVSTVEQLENDCGIGGLYGDKNIMQVIKDHNIIAMTWDKCLQLLDEEKFNTKEYPLNKFIVLRDEVHQIYIDTFRDKAIEGLYKLSSKCLGIIDITATPNKLDFSMYDNITEYKQEQQTKYNVKMYDDTRMSDVINIINKSKKSALLLNDIKKLQYISQTVNKKCDVIATDLKEQSELYQSIITASCMGGYEAMLNTIMINAGLNIYCPDMTDIIVYGIKDIAVIKQYVARFRDLKEVNIHIFNKYKNECKVYEVEWLIEKDTSIRQIMCDALNTQFEGKELTTLGLDYKAVNLDDKIFYCNETKKYEVDTIYIRSCVYRNYYNTRTFESFKILLNEYFEDIELIYCNENTNENMESFIKNKEIDNAIASYKKVCKIDKAAAIEELTKHKDILVGYQLIKKGKLTIKLKDYLRLNGQAIDQLQKDYLKYNIHNLICENGLLSTINNYSKYVLDYEFSHSVAWNLAFMSNRKRGNILQKMHTFVYHQIKAEYPYLIANDHLIETRVFNWITENFPIGTSYTKEHIELVSEALKITFGDGFDLSSNKIAEILNQIYVIEKRQVNTLEHSFYRNICPNGLTEGKKTQINTIKSIVDIASIKEAIGKNITDKSIEHYIIKTKNKILNQADLVGTESILKGWIK